MEKMWWIDWQKYRGTQSGQLSLNIRQRKRQNALGIKGEKAGVDLEKSAKAKRKWARYDPPPVPVRADGICPFNLNSGMKQFRHFD
jgi:hypothetical protein